MYISRLESKIRVRMTNLNIVYMLYMEKRHVLQNRHTHIHYIALHRIALHYITLQYTTLCYTTLHNIT